MQIDPQAQAPVVITTPAGGLALDPGRQVIARVIEVDAGGSARISLAGQTITVASSDVPLHAGDTLNLTVTGTNSGRITLSVDAQSRSALAQLPSPDTAGGLPNASRQLTDIAPNAIRELARVGVPVTPQLAQAVSKAIEQLVSEPGAGVTNTQTAARAVANLVARDFALNPAAASRVAAALDLAGQLGTGLAQLARQSPEVAAALPGSAPNAAALRSLLAGSLSPAELAVARIVQASNVAQGAQVAAPGGPVTLPVPPSSSPAVIANYVASQVAVTAHLDQLAATSTGQAVSLPGANGSLVNGQPADASLLASKLGSESLRGQGALPGQNTATHAPPPPSSAAATAAGTAAQVSLNAAAARPTAPAAASAAAAVGGGVTQSPTPAPVAQVIADLSISLGRFAAALAPAAGAAGEATQAQARALASSEQQAPAGTFTPQAAGGGPGGAPAPLVAAMQHALLTTGNHEQQQAATRSLLHALTNSNPAQVQAALTQLPESQSLQLVGRLLDAMPHGANGAANPAQHAELRALVHSALEQLGNTLQPASHDEHAVLRAALQHVADNDPRPAVADQARQLLHAAEGQQLLSQTRTGADPGYVYFQLPLPGQRSAEVLVRREPGRRAVTFDSFDIAFLLDTEAMGTLLIHLDAHPGAIRANIKTDVPALEPFLAAQAEALREPVEREARRPLLVSTSVFDNGATPTTLLEPQLGIVPGENFYYA